LHGQQLRVAPIAMVDGELRAIGRESFWVFADEVEPV
jgi:hypothetical protein